MFLRAGALAFFLLVASRLLGLARESTQAAAFGTSALGDVAVLMFTLPDWLAGMLASGALSYALLPAWARQSAPAVARSQRRVAVQLLAGGAVLAAVIALAREPAARWLAGGLTGADAALAARAILWSALALPLALLATLWTTRLQHEREFVGMYAANLVVNLALILTLAVTGLAASHEETGVAWLGSGLIAAMSLRLAWLHWRQRPFAAAAPSSPPPSALPPISLWIWAALAAGLPLVLPFAARSMASQSGEGGLATFNYAWKLVELPLVLAIQLVASIALPAIAKALGSDAVSGGKTATSAIRGGFALAWVLACAAAAGLVVAAPAIAQLLFGWGRMESAALTQVAEWGRIGAWGLPAQALIGIGLAVLAAQSRIRVAAAAYAVAALLLFIAGSAGVREGATLMLVLNGLAAFVAVAVLAALGPDLRTWLPGRALLAGGTGLLLAQALSRAGWLDGVNLTAQLAAGVAVGMVIIASAAWWSTDLKRSLRR